MNCIAPTSGGLPCPDESTKVETTSCDAPACWTDFGDWSSCIGSCGTTGLKSRKRSCINPTSGGLPCPDNSEETESHQCPTNPCCATGVKATDATTGDVLAGATVTYTVMGNEEKVAQTGEDGTLALGSLEMQTPVAIKLEKQFFDSNTDNIIVGDSCGSPIDMPLNPQSIDGRIVLTWSSDSPKDLDINMPSNQNCDIKYNKKSCGPNTLDKDNTVFGTTLLSITVC